MRPRRCVRSMPRHRRPPRAVSRSRSSIIIITTITIVAPWCASRRASRWSCRAAASIIITTTIITASIAVIDDRQTERPVSHAHGPLRRALILRLRRAVQMAVGAVEHGVGGRKPFGIAGEFWPVGMDAPRLHFALGGLFLGHRLQLESRLFRNDDDLRERLARTEDVCLALVR